MFIEERHEAILNLLREKGSVTTAELQREFGVGYESAKRDLRLLEEKGLLQRTHGGAIAVRRNDGARSDDSTAEDSLISDGSRTERFRPDVQIRTEVREIAQTAVRLVKSGETVFLPGGEIGLCLAELLPPDVRAVTGSLAVAGVLARRRAQVFLIGGEPDGQGECYDGFALETVGRFRYDLCFAAAEALSAEFGFSLSDGKKAAFWHTVLGASRRAAALCEGDALGREAFASVCPAERFGHIVVGRGAPDDALEAFYRRGIRVVLPTDDGLR